MPPKAKKVGLILVGDIGSSSRDQNSLDEEPFVDKMKYAMRLLIEKKMAVQPKDEIQIITMGDEETNNPEGMDFVKLYSENPMVPNWEMVKYINSLESTNNKSNWIEALHVALEHYKREMKSRCYLTIIVVFSTFKESEEILDDFEADIIAADIISTEDAAILFVGENKLPRDGNLSPSEQFFSRVEKRSSAQYESINNFIKMRRFYKMLPIKSVAWKFSLKWLGIKFPCSSYVHHTISTHKLGKWTRKSVKKVGYTTNRLEITEKKNIVKRTFMLDRARNTVPSENIIFGYKFGGKYIPVTDDDQKSMKSRNTFKGMRIYGFVPQDDVKLEFWSGKENRFIVSQQDKNKNLSQMYAEAFYCLVKAMVDMKYVAIVKKVYRDRFKAKLGVLFPKIDSNGTWGLVHLELPCFEGIKSIPKRPIRDNNVTLQQTIAMDSFIDAMTINDDDSEYLNGNHFPNIKRQYFYNALSYRAMNPNAPLLQPNDYLTNYLIPPDNLQLKVQPYLEQLNKVFSVPKKVKRKNQRKGAINKEVVVNKGEEKSDQVKRNVNQVKKDNPKNKNSIDEGFFSPDNIEFQTDELDDM